MPTYDLPIGFTLDHLHRPAGSEIKSTGPDAYSFVSGALSGTFTLTPSTGSGQAPTQITFPEETDPAVLTFVQAQLAKVGQPPDWDSTAVSLFNTAESAVGVAIADLTAAQRNALIALLLWDRKAIGTDLKIKPLAGWVRRRPAGG